MGTAEAIYTGLAIILLGLKIYVRKREEKIKRKIQESADRIESDPISEWELRYGKGGFKRK